MDNPKVVNGVLCFMQSAFNDYTKNELIDIAQSFYSTEDISTAKCLISEIMDENVISRRGADKKKKDVMDIYELLLKINSNDHKNTIFVTNNYKDIPPFNPKRSYPILNDISNSINDISKYLPTIQQQLEIMQEENNKVNYIKFDYIEKFISDDMTTLKSDLSMVKMSITEIDKKFSNHLRFENFKTVINPCSPKVHIEDSLLDLAANNSTLIDEFVTNIRNDSDNDSTSPRLEPITSNTIIGNRPSAPPLSQLTYDSDCEEPKIRRPTESITNNRTTYADIIKRNNVTSVS